jgi:hypothetical protein
MKTMKVFCRLAVLGASLALAASPGNAWQEFKGTFDLPVEARWGSVELHPGKYRVSIFPGTSSPLIRLEGEDGRAVMVLPLIREDRDASDKSALTLVQVDGNYYVRKFEAGDIGQVMTFRISSHRPSELALGRKADMRVPVSSIGK